jgi:hypothetical protein
VTGWLDSESYISMDAAALQAYNLIQNPPLRTATDFCRILPPSTDWGFDPNDAVEKKISLFSFIICFLSFNVLQKKYVIAIIKSIDILNKLERANIHGLENGFTMDASLHYSFGNLQLWFEHIAVGG